MSTYSKIPMAVATSKSGRWLERAITPQRAALAGMIAPVLWMTLLALLDVIQYDFLVSIGSNPLMQSPASENGVGPYGWLYVLNDFIFGALVITFALGLRQVVKVNWSARLGLISLLAFGAGFVFGSAPCDCLPGQAATWHGQLHNIASLVLLIATIPMSLFWGLGFRKDPRWRGLGWYSMATGVLAFPLFVLVNALPPVFSWFYIWLLAIPMVWLEAIALRLRMLTR
jgi:hypothetical protein